MGILTNKTKINAVLRDDNPNFGFIW